MTKTEGASLRDRILELRRLPASEILVNDRNFRTHPKAQRNALRGILSEVGIADALLAYHSERNGGRLTLIDGELRKTDNPQATWPVLVTNLNDSEADYLLSVLDPLSALAGADTEKLDALLREVSTGDSGVQEMLSKLAEQNSLIPPTAPDDFKSYDENLECEYKCPKCDYEWSGKPK